MCNAAESPSWPETLLLTVAATGATFRRQNRNCCLGSCCNFRVDHHYDAHDTHAGSPVELDINIARRVFSIAGDVCSHSPALAPACLPFPCRSSCPFLYHLSGIPTISNSERMKLLRSCERPDCHSVALPKVAQVTPRRYKLRSALSQEGASFALAISFACGQSPKQRIHASHAAPCTARSEHTRTNIHNCKNTAAQCNIGNTHILKSEVNMIPIEAVCLISPDEHC